MHLMSVLVLNLGCPAPPSLPMPPVPTYEIVTEDSDSGTDTGTPSDSSPKDTATKEEPPCSRWAPVHEVRTVNWETTPDNKVAKGGLEREWLGEVRPGIYRSETTLEYFFFSTQMTMESEGWVEFSCDKTGVYYEGLGGTFRFDDGPWQTWEEIPQSPALYVPADLGKGWDTLWDTKRTDDNGTSVGSGTETHEVLESDVVETSAGTFKTMRIRRRIGGGDSSYYHLSEDTGAVLFEGSIIVVGAP